jgi:hypothetical protein
MKLLQNDKTRIGVCRTVLVLLWWLALEAVVVAPPERTPPETAKI